MRPAHPQRMKGILMNHSPALLAAVVFGVFSLPALSQDKSTTDATALVVTAPGKAALVETVNISATVEAIDLPGRHVTVKGPKGKLSTLAIGPHVRNLDQVKVGDKILVRYEQALTLSLMKDGKELRSRSVSSSGNRAAVGAEPAGVVGKKIEVTADVTAVNAKTKMVTLKGPEQSVDLKVNDPEQFKAIRVGDQVQAVYTEAVAIALEPAAKK
ncbi:hypothetical protein SAMN05444747_1392 [Variovorax sp. OV329]|nr:hypothetical protein SAMN05444747_1392 [Variovorax sp. OV329]